MIRFARILALAAVLLFGASVARADLDQIRVAAEAGDADAQLELGILFEYGFNYKGNEIPALTWYMLAANQGSPKAAKLRDALMAKMSKPEIEEAIQHVTQFKPSGRPAAPSAPAEPAPAPPPAAEVESLPPLEAAPSEPTAATPPVEPAAAPAAPAPVEPPPAEPAQIAPPAQ